jgi:hypothetical protein
MKISHLIASAGIVGCTALAWFTLATAMSERTSESSQSMSREVAGVWNPALEQKHPAAWFETPNAPRGRAALLPASSDVLVDLKFVPKQRGLFRHRTYDVAFKGEYRFVNPTRIPQTVYISFPLPEGAEKLEGFEFRLGEENGTESSGSGDSCTVTRAVVLPASGEITLHTAYLTRGTDSWVYAFPDKNRIVGFVLKMTTDFSEINFPVGTGSSQG